jgi:hypothetical protein
MAKTPDAPTTPPWDASFTCDWGDCDRLTLAWRWSGQRLNESPLGWLPVCAIHAQHGRVSTDGPVPCADGTFVHDFKGQPVCPACGYAGIRLPMPGDGGA